MLALISPAKKLNLDNKIENSYDYTEPRFIGETTELVSILKEHSEDQLKVLMGLSDKLAALNHERYQDFKTPFKEDNASPAIFTFQGDTYVGFEAETLNKDDILYANNHVGILSGLYGFLRPLDLMQAYRLEMGTSLQNDKGKNLYEFWGDKITKACNEAIKGSASKTIVSLASNEYIKAVKPDLLDGDFITCGFKEIKNGTPRTIGLFAKRARGMMARFIVKNRIESPDGLKDFNSHGYRYDASLSDEKKLIFVRGVE